MHRGFVERTLTGLLHAMEHASASERIAERGGFLQSVDPRVKLAGCIALIVAAAVSHHVTLIALLFAIGAIAAMLSFVPIGALIRAWTILFLFTAMIAIPALFTTPGRSIGEIGPLTVTYQGLRAAAFLITRVETSGTFGLLLVATTPWPHLIAALRSLRIPSAIVLIIAMTYRYVFVLLRTSQEMFTARRSRSVGRLDPRTRRHIATSTAGVLLGKAMTLADDVYLAMQSRGFRGEVRLLDDFRMRARDWCAAAAFAVVAIAAFWGGLR